MKFLAGWMSLMMPNQPCQSTARKHSTHLHDAQYVLHIILEITR